MHKPRHAYPVVAERQTFMQNFVLIFNILYKIGYVRSQLADKKDIKLRMLQGS